MFPNDLEALRSGSFQVTCKNIRLKRRASRFPKIISGPGQITVSSNRFEIIIHAKFRKAVNDEALFGDSRAGDVIPEQEFFSMKASDYNGREWLADQVLIRAHTYPQGAAHWVQASCSVLYQTENFKSVNFRDSTVGLRFPKIDRLPYTATVRTKVKRPGRRSFPNLNRSAARFRARDYRVYFEEHADSLELEISMLPAYYHVDFRQRVSDSLNFLLGLRLQWYSCEIHHGNARTHLLRPYKHPGDELQIPPPARPWSPGTIETYWQVFASYLRTIGPHQGDSWHQLSAVQMMVMDAAGASVHGQILILSVAIESLVSWGADKLAKVVPVQAEEIEALTIKINDAAVSLNTQKRVLGSVRGLARVRAQDILTNLEAHGKISSLMLRRWKAARNSAAHGSFRERDTPDAICSDADILLALYYRVVMLITGYKGYLTDYSIKGWPPIDLKKKGRLPKNTSQ